MKRLSIILTILGMITLCPGLFAQKNAGQVELLQLNETVKAENSRFDLIFLGPTLIRINTKDGLIDLANPDVRNLQIQYAKAQCKVIADPDVRIFLPMVRQMTIPGIRELAGKLKASGELNEKGLAGSAMQAGITDTVRVLREYLKKYHTAGRPYILFGHSQGSLDLYCALRMMPEITPQDGFVAAYLPGLFPVKKEKISQDFAGRNILPGAGAKDTGVILVWNSHTDKPVKSSFFAAPGAFSVNPVNWKTSSKKCIVKAHRFLFQDSVKVFLKECAVWNDPADGCLKIQFAPTPQIAPSFAWGDTSMHEYDVWFFANNIRRNMNTRVKTYLTQRNQK